MMATITSTQPAFRYGILAAQLEPLPTAFSLPGHVAGAEAVEVAELLGIDFTASLFGIEDLRLGLEVERDLGSDCAPSMVDLADDDLVELGKVAVAHLLDQPDYYTWLTQPHAPGDPTPPQYRHADVGTD